MDWPGIEPMAQPTVFHLVLLSQIIACKQDRHSWQGVTNSHTFAVLLQSQGH
jgi:hypothetical protein